MSNNETIIPCYRYKKDYPNIINIIIKKNIFKKSCIMHIKYIYLWQTLSAKTIFEYFTTSKSQNSI